MNVLQKLAITASCITCLPLAGKDIEPDQIAGLAKYLPATGLLIGSLLAATAYLLQLTASTPLLSGVILCLSWIILTGGIHIDGLMDAADGIFSHRSPERMLEIMRDSRVGNFGVISGVGIILIKVTVLASLEFSIVLLLFILIPMWSRWCETFAIAYFPYARSEGMGKIWHDTTQFPRDLILATLLPLLITGACCYFLGTKEVVTLTLSCVAVGTMASFYLASIIKGHTGDTYGAVVELAETGALLISALLLNRI